MATKARTIRATGAKHCRECTHWREIKQRLRVTEALEKAIKKMETRLDDPDFKPTIGDYLRLVQTQQELEQGAQDVKEIRVTWVEPETSDSLR
jgi:hypothetical protein